jgi:hypothetical protein
VKKSNYKFQLAFLKLPRTKCVYLLLCAVSLAGNDKISQIVVNTVYALEKKKSAEVFFANLPILK